MNEACPASSENNKQEFIEPIDDFFQENTLETVQEEDDQESLRQSNPKVSENISDANAKRADNVDALFKDLARRQNLDAVVKNGWQNPLAHYSGPTVSIYQENCLDALESMEIGIIDEHDRARTAALVKCLLSRGVRRILKKIPDDWKNQLELLESNHRNFKEVVDYLRSVFALAAATDGVLRMSPILLAGSPGVGKSLFAARFAELIEISTVVIRMENAQTNATLAGGDRFWSNAKPGRILEQLVYGEYANPIFYLDEIDKVAADRYDPIAVLYSLLEPHTARQFTDLCFPFLTLDASFITWVATCNDTALLPPPLLSRFKTFEIAAPNYADALRIAENITDAIREEYAKFGLKIKFSPEILNSLVLYSPRRMQQLAREATGHALYLGHHLVTGTDIKSPAPVSRTIGFR